MDGYYERDKDGNFVEVFCPYSEDGKCKACKILSINCDGEKFYDCEQYRMTERNK